MPAIRSTFTGTLTLFSTSPQFPGPKVVDPFSFVATFEDNGDWTVAVDDFSHSEPDIGDDGVTLHVKLKEPAEGESDVATGKASLEATFKFRALIVSSTLKLSFSTDTQHATWPIAGKPIDRDAGTLALAASGTFNGTLLGGEECGVMLDGAFAPNPWKV